MKAEEIDHTLQAAIQKWGVEFNLNMLTEEFGELLQALNKLRRAGGITDQSILKPVPITGPNYSLRYFDLCSEVADVKNMIRLLELLLDQQAIELSQDRKLMRLQERIKNNNP